VPVVVQQQTAAPALVFANQQTAANQSNTSFSSSGINLGDEAMGLNTFSKQQ
jgi:hypothetical protein